MKSKCPKCGVERRLGAIYGSYYSVKGRALGMKTLMSWILLCMILSVFTLSNTGSAFAQEDQEEDPGNPGYPIHGETLDEDEGGEDSIPSNFDDPNAPRGKPIFKFPIIYDPLLYDNMVDVELGLDQTISILNFSDKRERAGPVVGTMDHMIYHLPVIYIQSERPLNLAIIDVMGALFNANRFRVKKFPKISDTSMLRDGGLALIGQVNKFWVKIYNKMEATVDIDVKIVDLKSNKTIWAGKIQGEDEQKVETTSKGLWLWKVRGDENEMVPFLNKVLGNALQKAWLKQGMRDAVANISKKVKIEKATTDTLNRQVQVKPDTGNANAYLKLGLSYYKLGKYKASISAFKKSMDLKPGWARAHYHLGLLYLKNGKEELAIEQYEILKGLDKNYANKLFENIYK